MPLEICTMAQHNKIKICKNDFQTAPDKGFCGYKLHGVCTASETF